MVTNSFEQTRPVAAIACDEPAGARSTRQRWCRRSRLPRARVTVASIGLLAGVLAGCSDATKSDEASTAGADRVTSTASTTSSGAATPAATETSSGHKIVGEISGGALKPGGYALPPMGPLDEPFAVVDIPAGYTSWETFIEAEKPAEPEDPLMIGLWVITGVYLNPCAESNEVAPRSVRATADAFLQQRLTSTTGPREVDLAGYHGLYMEITTPTDLDYGACDDAELNLWEGRPVGGYWTRMPGMVNRLWILDVDGQPMVIQMAVPPSATGPQIHAMTDIVEAATFEKS
jgi:hypothetical protein